MLLRLVGFLLCVLRWFLWAAPASAGCETARFSPFFSELFSLSTTFASWETGSPPGADVCRLKREGDSLLAADQQQQTFTCGGSEAAILKHGGLSGKTGAF